MRAQPSARAVAEALLLSRAGLSHAQAARCTGLSRHTVSWYARRAGLAKPTCSAISPQRVEAARAALISGETRRSIALRMQMSERTLSRLRRELVLEGAFARALRTAHDDGVRSFDVRTPSDNARSLLAVKHATAKRLRSSTCDSSSRP